MCRVYLSVGTHNIKVFVQAEDRQCDCMVICEQGVAVIWAPFDNAIRAALLNMPGLLQMMRRLDPTIRCLKLCAQS